MRKTSILLAVALVLLIAFTCGCTPKSAQPAQPTATLSPSSGDSPESTADADVLKNAKPNEYVKERLEAGEEVLIACCMIVDVPVLMEVFANDIKKVIEPYGFTWTLSHAGGDTATMMGQIENYALMGAACIIAVPPDANTIRDSVLAAIDKGSSVVLYGVAGVDYCYSVRVDTTKLGDATSKMALAWAHGQYPDASPENPIKFAAMYSSSVVDSQIQGESMIATLEADPAVQLCYTDNGSEGSVDHGYEIAQAALTYDNGIRVFVSTQGTDSLGASNYIMAQPGLDYAQYGVFGGACDTAGLESIKNLAADNRAVLRGSIEYVLTAGESMGTCAVKALFGEWSNPYEMLMEGYAFVQPGFDFKISIQ